MNFPVKFLKSLTALCALCISPLCAQTQPPVSAAVATAAAAQQPPDAPQKGDAAESPAQRKFSERVENLLKNNPFGSSGKKEGISGANKTPEGLELRSVFRVDGKWFFGVFDSGTKRSYTLPLGKKTDKDAIYEVDFFDDETNSISLTSAIGSYTLTLKEPDRATASAKAPAAKKKDDQTKTQKTKTNERRRHWGFIPAENESAASAKADSIRGRGLNRR